MNTYNKLVKYGLSKAEATVYLDILSNLDSSAFSIYKRVKLPKTSVYHILESLQKRGLVGSWKKNNISYFSAENPNRLISEVKEKEDLVKALVPDLVSFFNTKDPDDSVKMYEGSEGIKTVMHDALDYCAKHKINSMLTAANNSFSLSMPKFIDKWVEEREEMNIFVKFLFPGKEIVPEDHKSRPLRETRYLPRDFQLPGIINIYGDRVDLFSMKNDKLNAVVIESKVYTDLLRSFFLHIWETAEK